VNINQLIGAIQILKRGNIMEKNDVIEELNDEVDRDRYKYMEDIMNSDNYVKEFLDNLDVIMQNHKKYLITSLHKTDKIKLRNLRKEVSIKFMNTFKLDETLKLVKRSSEENICNDIFLMITSVCENKLGHGVIDEVFRYGNTMDKSANNTIISGTPGNNNNTQSDLEIDNNKKENKKLKLTNKVNINQSSYDELLKHILNQNRIIGNMESTINKLLNNVDRNHDDIKEIKKTIFKIEIKINNNGKMDEKQEQCVFKRPMQKNKRSASPSNKETNEYTPSKPKNQKKNGEDLEFSQNYNPSWKITNDVPNFLIENSSSPILQRKSAETINIVKKTRDDSIINGCNTYETNNVKDNIKNQQESDQELEKIAVDNKINNTEMEFLEEELGSEVITKKASIPEYENKEANVSKSNTQKPNGIQTPKPSYKDVLKKRDQNTQEIVIKKVKANKNTEEKTDSRDAEYSGKNNDKNEEWKTKEKKKPFKKHQNFYNGNNYQERYNDYETKNYEQDNYYDQYYKKKYKTIVIGKNEQFNNLATKRPTARMFPMYIGRIKKEVSDDQVEKILTELKLEIELNKFEKLNINEIKKLNVTHNKFKSFCCIIPYQQKDYIFNPKVWPLGWTVSKFVESKRTVNNEVRSTQ
jgi:hypothetical protein